MYCLLYSHSHVHWNSFGDTTQVTSSTGQCKKELSVTLSTQSSAHPTATEQPLFLQEQGTRKAPAVVHSRGHRWWCRTGTGCIPQKTSWCEICPSQQVLGLEGASQQPPEPVSEQETLLHCLHAKCVSTATDSQFSLRHSQIHIWCFPLTVWLSQKQITAARQTKREAALSRRQIRTKY